MQRRLLLSLLAVMVCSEGGSSSLLDRWRVNYHLAAQMPRNLLLRGGTGPDAKGERGIAGSHAPLRRWDDLLKPEDRQEWPLDETLEYKGKCGIGLAISRDAPFTVLSIQPGSPISESGIVSVGDVVVSVDGQSVEDMTYTELRDLSLGEKGSKVSLQFMRGGQGQCDGVQTYVCEVARGEGFLPWFTRRGEGVDEEAKELEQLLGDEGGIPLAERAAALGIKLDEFGTWEEVRASSGVVSYRNTYTGKTQVQKPASFQYLERCRASKEGRGEVALEAYEKLKELSATHKGGGDPEKVAGIKMEEMRQELRENIMRTCGIDIDAITNERVEELVSSCEELEEGAPLMFEPGGPGDWYGVPLKGKVTEEEIRSLFIGKMPELGSRTSVTAGAATAGGHKREAGGSAGGGHGSPPGGVQAPPAGGEAKPQVGEMGFAEQLNAWVAKSVAAHEDANEGKVDDKAREAAARIRVRMEMDAEVHMGLDPERFAQEHGGDVASAYRDLGPDEVPAGTADCYRALRLMRAMQRRMAERGEHFSNPLLYGVDPFYDRCDFQISSQEGGGIQARYVGDCVPGGYRRRHRY